jgi:hypothetical protein
MAASTTSPRSRTSAREVARLLAAGATVIAMTDTDVERTVGHACSVTLLLPDGQIRVLTADHDLLTGCGGCTTAELR